MKPYFQNRNAICFACDSKYLDKTYVCIKSIIENAIKAENYEIVILETNIPEYLKKEFYSLDTENIKIRFFDMNELIRTKGINNFFVSRHISVATYFRFFIPEIFSSYEKILYLDGDIIVCKNVNNLLDEELNDCLLGVIKDTDRFVFTPERVNYIEKQLKMSYEDYFCSGVILYNIEACKTFNLTEKCCRLLDNISEPMFHDQDILNSVSNGFVKFLPTKWHFQAWVITFNTLPRLKEKSPQSAYDDYIETSKDFNLIHFGGRLKPWHQASQPLAQYWWNVARATPFYESFVYEMQQYQFNASLKHLNSLVKQNQIDVIHKITALNQTINEIPQQLDASLKHLNSHVKQNQIEVINKQIEAINKITDINQRILLMSQSTSLKLRRFFYSLLSKISFGQYKNKKLKRLQQIKDKLKQLNC